jgi:putative transposase
MATGSDSKSTVSRRFVAETQAWLEEWLSRPLDGERYLALVLDGLELGAHHVIAALGVTAAGDKRVLGLWEGATENAEVCRALLEDLVRRGLSVDRGLLVIIDGGQGLAAAVRTVLGDRVLLQRCTVHKTRNVLDKLPEHRRAALRRALRRAWSAQDVTVAERQLRSLICRLEEAGEVAAARSLAEGLEETLTCVRLGLHPELRASLESTNLIESACTQLTKRRGAAPAAA